MRYALIYGELFRQYTGTMSCTGLAIYGAYKTKKELRNAIRECNKNKSDLMIAIDLQTGKEVS